jgi:hypothetical protein
MLPFERMVGAIPLYRVKPTMFLDPAGFGGGLRYRLTHPITHATAVACGFIEF